MALNIIGCQTLSGTYEGHEYNKLKLHCMKDPDKNTIGNGVEIISLNMSDCADLLKSVGGELNGLIGKRIDVYYNQYRKPSKVDIL